MYLDFVGFVFGSLQCLDELYIIHRVPLRGGQFVQDLVLYFFQLLSHFRVADDQLVFGFFQIGPLLCYRKSQHLVLQPTNNQRTTTVSEYSFG